MKQAEDRNEQVEFAGSIDKGVATPEGVGAELPDEALTQVAGGRYMYSGRYVCPRCLSGILPEDYEYHVAHCQGPTII